MENSIFLCSTIFINHFEHDVTVQLHARLYEMNMSLTLKKRISL